MKVRTGARKTARYEYYESGSHISQSLTLGAQVQDGNVLHRTLGVPTDWLRVLKTRLEMIAPIFPLAAEIPCAVARYFVGNTSAGYMYV